MRMVLLLVRAMRMVLLLCPVVLPLGILCTTQGAEDHGASVRAIDCYISTGDNHWLGASLLIDSKASFDMLKDVWNVRRVYWRGLEEATWLETMQVREESCRYTSFWRWIERLYREVDPDRLAVGAAHRRGMEIWGGVMRNP